MLRPTASIRASFLESSFLSSSSTRRLLTPCRLRLTGVVARELVDAPGVPPGVFGVMNDLIEGVLSGVLFFLSLLRALLGVLC